MIDSLTSDNYTEFGRRYCETFGWLLKEEKEIFVFISRVTSERVTFENGKGIAYHANINSDIKFKFIPVKNGWFNADNGETYLLTRVPVRQWKRGISTTNTNIINLSRQSMPVCWEILSTIFCDSFKELNYSKEFKGRSCAISPHFAISHNLDILFYQKVIGTFDVVNKKFILDNNLVKQELEDLITRNSWELKVVCNEN